MNLNIFEKITEKTSFAVYLDNFLSQKNRRRLSNIFAGVALFFLLITSLIKISFWQLNGFFALILSFVLSLVSNIPGIDITSVDIVSVQVIPFVSLPTINLFSGLHFWNGIMLISFILYLKVKLIGLYIKSFENNNISRIENSRKPSVAFDVLKVFHSVKHGDLVSTFLNSKVGLKVINRLGLERESIVEYLNSRSLVVDYNNDSSLYKIRTINDLSLFLYDDLSFHSFLDRNNIGISDIDLASRIVEEEVNYEIIHNRYFGKEVLSRSIKFVEAIVFCEASFLFKYTTEIKPFFAISYPNSLKVYADRAVTLFLNNRSINLFLIAESKENSIIIANLFTKSVGSAALGLDKQLLNFDVHKFISDVYSSDSFVNGLEQFFAEAANSGRNILLISDFFVLIKEAKKRDVDLLQILSPYVTSDSLTIICLMNDKEYSSGLFQKGISAQHFEEVHVTHDDNFAILKSIIPFLLDIEHKNKTVFSTQAIKKIIDVFKSNNECVLASEIKKVLLDLSKYSLISSKDIVKGEDVEKYLSLVTRPLPVLCHFDLSKISDFKRELEKNIVGQYRVVNNFLNAITNFLQGGCPKNNKILSFLLFQIDDVTKTRIISILSNTFYSEDNRILYLDMNVYSDIRGLSRLIGTLGGKKGTLPLLLDRMKSGVVAFNNLEKAHLSVQDFLAETIETGILRSSGGALIDCTQMIFISSLNLDSLSNDDVGDINESKESIIINEIRNMKILSPRCFDSFSVKTIFSPHSNDDVYEVTEVLLCDRSKLYKQNGIILNVDSFLIEKVLSYTRESIPNLSEISDIIKREVDPIIIKKKMYEAESNLYMITLKEDDFIN